MGNNFQPLIGSFLEKVFNNVGATKVVIAAPAFPIPKIPNALPCQFCGYQTEVYPIPTAKLVPTNPKRKLNTAKLQKVSAKGSMKRGIEQSNNKAEKTILPPNLSVKIPIGNLKTDPDKIGIPNNQPTSITVQLKIPLSTKKVTKTPFKVQQAKQIVKAKVFRNNILWDCDKLLILEILNSESTLKLLL